MYMLSVLYTGIYEPVYVNRNKNRHTHEQQFNVISVLLQVLLFFMMNIYKPEQTRTN